MEKQPISGSEQKIQEYAERIRNGEDKDFVLQGLPNSFLHAVERELELSNNSENNIPPQYKGMSKEAIDFAWVIPEYIDEEKTRQERERKSRVLDSINNTGDTNIDNEIENIKSDILSSFESDKTLKEIAENLVDNRKSISFETVVYNNGKYEKISGESDIISFADRKIVVIEIAGKNMPFYLSTGHGGKIDVTSGKWYPMFGIKASEGWINKQSGEQINNYYNCPILKEVSLSLDEKIGDIRNDDSIQKVGAKGQHMDIINRDMSPVENEKPDTKILMEKNIKEIVDYFNNEFRDKIKNWN